MTRQEFESRALPLIDPLYNFARWMSSSEDEAQDLVQETFAKALKGLSSFRDGTNFRAWMFRILRNTFLNSRTGLAQRNTVQESEEGLAELAIDSETPELTFLRRIDTEWVRQAIANLPPPFREALILADLEEMSTRRSPIPSTSPWEPSCRGSHVRGGCFDEISNRDRASRKWPRRERLVGDDVHQERRGCQIRGRRPRRA